MTVKDLHTITIASGQYPKTLKFHVAFIWKPETCIESCQNEDNFEEEMKLESPKSDLQGSIATEKPEETFISSKDERVVVMKNKVVRNTVSSNTLRRFLKYALPLPLILMFIFGGLYLLYDDWFECLDKYGLTIAPQLHHVRGAPPV